MSKGTEPAIAVLMAAYNGMDFISEQVESIFNQLDVDVHLFISVDLSTDNTYEWCKQLELNSQNVTLLEYGERFGGAAKNFFRLIKDVDFSRYDYIALADQDDVWLSNKLIHAVELIKAKNVDAVSSDVIAFWENGKERLVKKSYPQKTFDYYFEAGGPGCTYVLKVRAVKLFKIFLIKNWHSVTQVFLHDWMIYAFFRSNRMNWLIDDVPLVRYRQHDANQVGFNSGFKAYLNRILMVKSEWYHLEIKKIMVLMSPFDETEFLCDRFFLIKHFWQLRRRPRDAIALLLMMLFRVF